MTPENDFILAIVVKLFDSCEIKKRWNRTNDRDRLIFPLSRPIKHKLITGLKLRCKEK